MMMDIFIYGESWPITSYLLYHANNHTKQLNQLKERARTVQILSISELLSKVSQSSSPLVFMDILAHEHILLLSSLHHINPNVIIVICSDRSIFVDRCVANYFSNTHVIEYRNIANDFPLYISRRLRYKNTHNRQNFINVKFLSQSLKYTIEKINNYIVAHHLTCIATGLHKRETQVLFLILSGYSITMISTLLNISIKTVYHHRREINQRLDIRKFEDHRKNILVDIKWQKELDVEMDISKHAARSHTSVA